jgi:hypothetical protein
MARLGNAAAGAFLGSVAAETKGREQVLSGMMPPLAAQKACHCLMHQ